MNRFGLSMINYFFPTSEVICAVTVNMHDPCMRSSFGDRGREGARPAARLGRLEFEFLLAHISAHRNSFVSSHLTCNLFTSVYTAHCHPAQYTLRQTLVSAYPTPNNAIPLLAATCELVVSPQCNLRETPHHFISSRSRAETTR